ncbi:serine/threonine protein kinase [Bacillus cytotoxicus]|uniref:protein kinase domain-containing protein n=1 Tax=Bacillus cereus group sp. BfR-BA-01492 TaxID=2920361 RepID=UPI001F5A8EEB|nr:serine/threonine protein kinase [Bacillus cereus group sp. BfR-BA-01492]EMA6342998.1 serine/threonine protein kinase [Bacillus cytotoxicus]
MKELPVTIHLDHVTFQLKEHQDFKWLTKLGKVFAVFDEQDSGNLSFGIEQDGIQSFVKFAGAKPMNYEGKPSDAARCLKQAVPLYQELKHHHLISLKDHFEVNNGYVAIFEWFHGESLRPKLQNQLTLASSFERYKQLPIEKRLTSIDCIFNFHVHVEQRNYVAIDFYDGSILYDFKTNTTKICDIDLYAQKPYVNFMGRMWGSSRFMSPEEFELGAQIDEKTNVFNMGAMAFSLLGGGLNRSFAKWEAGKPLYDVACYAVESDRNKRYTSVKAFYEAWCSV